VAREFKTVFAAFKRQAPNSNKIPWFSFTKPDRRSPASRNQGLPVLPLSDLRTRKGPNIGPPHCPTGSQPLITSPGCGRSATVSARSPPGAPSARRRRRCLHPEPGLHDLARLRREGLIRRHAGTNTYALKLDGLRVAIFYTKVHDQLLPIAGRRRTPTGPVELGHAIRLTDRPVHAFADNARLGTAAENSRRAHMMSSDQGR
jgi:hypothetical protein